MSPAEGLCPAQRLRLRYNISQRELAQAAGVSIQHISRVERREEPYRTQGCERLMTKAFAAVARERREQAERLSAELAALEGRLMTEETEEEP